jgi:transcriptional regulator with XRE-family HTH domain
VPAREGARATHSKTKLVRLRVARDISIKNAAPFIGIEPSTLWRLEHGLIKSPRLGWLVNAAAFYGVSLSEVIEDDWLEWHATSRGDTDARFQFMWGEQAIEEPPPIERPVGAPVALERRR